MLGKDYTPLIYSTCMERCVWVCSVFLVMDRAPLRAWIVLLYIGSIPIPSSMDEEALYKFSSSFLDFFSPNRTILKFAELDSAQFEILFVRKSE